jgi:hypothetical protein
MSQLIRLTEQQFDDQFPLIRNHLNPNASWAFGEGPGCLFETYGEEFAFVQAQDRQRVWTFVDGDDGKQYVLSGLGMVNRIGYLISRDPIPEGQNFEVTLDTID